MGRKGSSGMSGGAGGGSVAESGAAYGGGGGSATFTTNNGDVSVSITKDNADRAASEYFSDMDKGTARMQAESWVKGTSDEDAPWKWMAERNTAQKMVNNAGNPGNGYLGWDDYNSAVSSGQKQIIQSAVTQAARDYIEKDKQTKAGARYWKKAGL